MNIGLIAHDNKKKLMENLCIAYRHILCKHELYATGTTGRLVEEAYSSLVTGMIRQCRPLFSMIIFAKSAQDRKPSLRT